MNPRNLPNEIINIIMRYVPKNNIYRPMLTIRANIDLVNCYYNNPIPFHTYFLFKKKLLSYHTKQGTQI
jgi:hypothetical protein